MTLQELTRELKLPSPQKNRSIDVIAQHPMQANEKSVFVCLKGARHDGHEHAMEAYQNGCRIFVAQSPLSLPDDAYVFYVPSTRSALAILACCFFDHPSRKMRVVGVTGTKGKTTVASLIRALLEHAGISCGYVGTNGVAYKDTAYRLANTTPDPVTLQSILRDMYECGTEAVVIEISSQAVYQARIEGLAIDTCVYTNLYTDHIGPTEHPSFAHYMDCKRRIFSDYGCKTMICNTDDEHCTVMRETASAAKTVTYAIECGSADYTAQSILQFNAEKDFGTEFLLCSKESRLPCSISMPGLFNVYNALAAVAVARECFAIPLDVCASALRSASVEGRTEMIPLPNGATAVIDYAHNGSSLSQLLTAMRAYHPNRLLCLFGSVGERSQLRRRELGIVAASLCDLAILTSDNPGCENPQDIIDEIARPFSESKTPFLSIIDRQAAIKAAVDLTRKGDILVLAGKGHEQYQLIGKEKLPYSDADALRKAIL